jgi:hypothetical protein
MRKALKKRPSPAMIVAVLALVLATAGTSFAAVKIRSGQIADGTIRARDVHKNTLTGEQIRENKLGTVPSAEQARSAEVATTATTATNLAPTATAGLKTRWLLLNEQGQIEEQSGGFTVIDAYKTNQNVYIDAGSSLAGHGLSATIAIQNKIDAKGDGGADPNFAGEVSVARCQTAAVECAPPGAKTVNALVVSPQTSEGKPTAGTAENPRKRVYVEVTD